MAEDKKMAPKKDYIWSTLKDFTDDVTEITVRVQGNDAHRPRYSIQIGRLRGTFLAPHLPVYVTTEHARVNGLSDYTEVIAELLLGARAFIADKAQAREDELMSERIAKEERSTHKTKPTMGLKNLSKQDALKHAVKASP